MNPTTEHLSNARIKALFDNTRFGPQGETMEGRRQLMAECVIKAAAGYAAGHTIEEICREAGLITPRQTQNRPTPEGLKWAVEHVIAQGEASLKPLLTSCLVPLYNVIRDHRADTDESREKCLDTLEIIEKFIAADTNPTLPFVVVIAKKTDGSYKPGTEVFPYQEKSPITRERFTIDEFLALATCRTPAFAAVGISKETGKEVLTHMRFLTEFEIRTSKEKTAPKEEDDEYEENEDKPSPQKLRVPADTWEKIREIANRSGDPELVKLAHSIEIPDLSPEAEIRRAEIITQAAALSCVNEGEVEIDQDATLSEGDENGCYVSGWIWYSFAGTEFDKEATQSP